MRSQQSVRVGRGEPGEVRLPEPGGGLGPEPGAKRRTASGHDIGVQIVENQAAAGRTQRGEVGQCRIKRVPGEVSGDAEPNDQARPGGVESAVEKLLAERVVLEIARNPNNRVGGLHGPEPLHDCPFVCLGGRCVHLEDLHGALRDSAQRGGVESGTQQHQLVDTIVDGGLDHIVGVARPQDQEKMAGCAEYRFQYLDECASGQRVDQTHP
ncbi:Uncharacterised protein [Mycobacteroides abscessus]|nr:Uncharacterised protein [Mycobacteroides abscessus]